MEKVVKSLSTISATCQTIIHIKCVINVMHLMKNITVTGNGPATTFYQKIVPRTSKVSDNEISNDTVH